MIKSYHILFLKVLDDILSVANSPYLNYTVPKETVVKIVEPKIVYDNLYENKKSKFLVKNYDRFTEANAKKYLIDSALDYLTIEGYLNKRRLESIVTYQITHKGFLKIHLGFKKEFKNEKLKLDNLKSQTNFENLMKVLAILIPALLSFFLGKLL